MPQEHPTIPTLHTLQEAAELTGVPLHIIRKACTARRLEVVRFNRRVYVTGQALADWITSNTRESAQ